MTYAQILYRIELIREGVLLAKTMSIPVPGKSLSADSTDLNPTSCVFRYQSSCNKRRDGQFDRHTVSNTV